MKTKQLTTLQAGRGLAALSVLLFHCHLLIASPKYFGADIASPLMAGYAGVPYFFVLSGFVIFLAHRHELGQPGTLTNFLWKRFRRIYPPLWLVLLLVLPVFFLFPTFGPRARHISAVLSAFLITPTARSESFITVEWTLRHEILFYLLFSTALLRKNLGIAVLCIWFLLSAVFPLLGIRHHHPLLSFYFASYHILFALGIAVCLLYARRRIPNAASWPLLLAGIVVFSAAWLYQVRSPLYSRQVLYLIFGLGAALMVLGFVNLERNGALRAHRILVYLGNASYAIYLVHYTVLVFATKALMHTSLRSAPYLSLFLLTAIATLAGCIFHTFLERPVVSWLSRQHAGATSALTPSSDPVISTN